MPPPALLPVCDEAAGGQARSESMDWNPPYRAIGFRRGNAARRMNAAMSKRETGGLIRFTLDYLAKNTCEWRVSLKEMMGKE